MKWTIWLVMMLIVTPSIAGLGTQIAPEPDVILDLPELAGKTATETNLKAENTPSQQNETAEGPDIPSYLKGEIPANLREVAWGILDEKMAELPIADAQAPGFEMLRFMAQPNGTNETVLNQTGTVTHTHNGVGGNGLYEAWNLPFYGETRLIREVDVNRDGVQDAVLGTSTAVVAIAGTGELLWAYPIGNTIRSLEYMPETHELLYATLWEGQLGEYGRIDAATGHINWKAAEANHFISAAALTDGILLATVDGFIIKTDFEGVEQWRYDTRIIPDVAAILVAHVNLGTYLAEPADYDGDGVVDMAVATLNLRFVIGLYANSIEYYTQIHAVSGATGTMLWLGQENADPVVGISINALADFEAFDARGDGTQDLAYDGVTLRFYYVAAAFMITYETFLRAIDGDSDLVAQSMGGRTLPGVLLPLELYGDIERVDANGDGMEEVAVIRIDVAGVLLGGTATVESYSFLPHTPDNGATMLLSDIVITNGVSPTISTFEADGIQLFVGSLVDKTGLLVASNLRDETEIQFNAAPRVGTQINGKIGFATASSFHQGDIITPLRGNPEQLFSGHYDNDGTPDFFVVSSDQFVYSVDGLNGKITQASEITGTVINMEDVNKDGQVDIVEQVFDNSGPKLIASDLAGATIWVAEMSSSGFYFDQGVAKFDGNGDGITDYITDTYELTAVNGANGATLWKSNVENNFFWDSVQGTPDGDVLLVDWRTIIRVNGEDGRKMFEHELETSQYIGCFGTVLGSDGPNTLVAAWDFFEDSFMTQVSPSGKTTNVPIFGAGDLVGCEITPAGEEALISYHIVSDEQLSQKLARIASSGVVWKESAGNSFDRYSPIGLDEASNTVYFAWQDHIRGRNWTSGETVSDFGFNGPFVVGSVMANVDRLGTPEIASLASNGILWLVSTDEGVQETLNQQATNLGKEAIPTNEAAVPDVKETPFPFALFGLALLALVRRRRN